MRFTRFFVLALLAALLAVPVAVAATETVTTVERIPFDSEVFSECTGEDIDVEGTIVMVSHITTTTNASGDIIGSRQHLTLAVADVKGTTRQASRSCSRSRTSFSSTSARTARTPI